MTGLILLAAGESARMGQPKQLLRFGGRTLLRRAAEEAVASGCQPVTVVLGALADRMTAELSDLPVRVVINREWEEGLGGSIRAGMEALLAGPDGDRVEAVVMTLCDQPFCTAAVIRRLMAAHDELKSPAVASSYDGVRGVPALFGRALFPELLELTGPEGARRILQRHADETIEVALGDAAGDIDTPEDYVTAHHGDTESTEVTRRGVRTELS